MKKNLIIFLVILITHPLYSQIQSVSVFAGSPNTPHRIDITQGKVLEVIDYKSQTYNPDSVSLNGNIGLVEKVFSASTTYTPRVFVKFIPGPAFLDIQSLGDPIYFSYRIHDNSPTPTQLPSNSVVIPSDANGNVRVVLESSVDMVNWTEALPGTYGASTTKRFFRIRVVNQ
jgi:hypothetical protein